MVLKTIGTYCIEYEFDLVKSQKRSSTQGLYENTYKFQCIHVIKLT